MNKQMAPGIQHQLTSHYSLQTPSSDKFSVSQTGLDIIGLILVKAWHSKCEAQCLRLRCVQYDVSVLVPFTIFMRLPLCWHMPLSYTHISNAYNWHVSFLQWLVD